MKKDKTFRPDRVLSYFKAEWLPLARSWWQRRAV